MSDITVRDVTAETADDLCRVCVPPGRRDEPAFVTGRGEKRTWVLEMLRTYGPFAKVAYADGVPAGQIQYRPVPERKLVFVYCIYVPEQEHWRLGIATRLVDALLDDVRRPLGWFGDHPAAALVTKTFPGEKPGQFSARAFFVSKGFRAVGDDPDVLYYPLSGDADAAVLAARGIESAEDLIWPNQSAAYVRQEADRGIAVIIHGPSFCPFSFSLLKKAEALIREVAPSLQVRWISASDQPQEAATRGDFRGCVVNAVPVTAFVLDRTRFVHEVEAALGRT